MAYLKRRGAVYWAQLAVPLDLQNVLGKKTMEKSLKTRDREEAKRTVLDVCAKWRDQFADTRRRMNLTGEDMTAATWRHYADTLRRDDTFRQSAPSDVEIDAAKEAALERVERDGLDHRDPLTALDLTLDVAVLEQRMALDAEIRRAKLADLRKHLATGRTALIENEVSAYLAERDILVGKDSQERRDLAARLMRAEIEALERTFERDLGNFSGKPVDPIIVPVADRGEPTMTLFDEYAKENAKGVTADTLVQARRDVQLFVAATGATTVDQVTKAAIRKWKGLLLDYPVKAAEIAAFRGMTMQETLEANKTLGKPKISDRTVNRYLGAVGAFCDWLVLHELLEKNPVSGLHQSVDKAKSKPKVFTSDQLNTLFSSPLFTGCRRDDRWSEAGNHRIRDHRYWIPLVMAFSGARPGEIAQLLVGDVREEHGVSIMHITSDGEDQSTKTKGSKRIVPVHSELVRLGFLAYRDRMIAAGETKLFPKAERNSRGQMVADFSRDFGRYLTRIGLKDGRGLSLYSLRHGFADALRRAEYLDEQFGFLLGHSRQTMTGQYGHLPQGMLRQRVEMIEAVSYQGLDLRFLQYNL